MCLHTPQIAERVDNLYILTVRLDFGNAPIRSDTGHPVSLISCRHSMLSGC